jgi:hypothetical protein
MMSAVGYVEPIKRLEKTFTEWGEARGEKKILELVRQGYTLSEIEKVVQEDVKYISEPQAQ